MIDNIHPQTEGEENIPPTMLFRHFLDVIDSVSILVQKGSGDTPKILLRGAFEVMIYLEYIFEQRTIDRRMAFLIMDILKQIKSAKKLLKDTNEGKDLYATFKREKILNDLILSDPQTLELINFIESKERLLNMPQFKVWLYDEYQKLASNKIKNIKWYSFYDGKTNLADLSKHFNHYTMYELLYRKWSDAVHGSDIYMGKVFKTDIENKVDIVQLRFAKHVQDAVTNAMVISIKVFQLFVLNRIPVKTNDFILWNAKIRPILFDLNSKPYITVS